MRTTLFPVYAPARARAWVARALAVAALSLVGSGPLMAADKPAVTTPQIDNPKRVLLVGNSYLYYGDSLHNHLRRMVAAADPATGKALQYKSATIGGATLDHHPIEWLTEPGRIGVKDPFELVVLQGNSADALSARGQEAYRKAVAHAHQVVTSRGAKVALYMPPSYVAPHKQAKPEHNRTNESFFVSVANQLGVIVIPVGLAFEEAYRRHPEMKLHKAYDGSHPTLAGTYLGAATFYATLYGKSPVGNTFDVFGDLDADTRLKLQKVADDTVRAFFAR